MRRIISKEKFAYDENYSNKIMPIAGKYLAEVDPSNAMASAKIEGKIKGLRLSPGRAMLQANPRLAFGASDLGLSQNESAYYS
jgi:hypothetical protein